MKPPAILFLCLLNFAACKKDETFNATPKCIREKIELFKNEANVIAVKKTVVGVETHYLFDIAYSPVDGTPKAWILNEACDSICYFCRGFCVDPWCAEEYVLAEWETIWEK